MNYIPVILAVSFLVLTGCSEESQGENPPQTNEKAALQKEEKQTEEQKQEQEESKEQEVLDEEAMSQPVQDYQVNTNNWKIEPVSDENAKVALLTIDDAPDEHALEMAEILKELDVSAVFFVNGHFIESEEKQAIVKQIADMGFEIGNHTYSHASLPSITEQEQEEEIKRVNSLVEKATGSKPRFFRAPFGENTDFSKKVVKEEGMQFMNWTMGYDWNKEYQSKEALIDITLNSESLYSGANILMHDRAWTKEALADIVRGLQEKGYEILDPKRIKS